MFAEHLDLSKPLVWTVERALPAERCQLYIDRFHASVPEQAPVIVKDGVGIDLAVRNNTRVMWDSAEDANELVELVGELGDGVASRITLGETDFPELGKRVVPTRGSALLFQHRVLHSALSVTASVKYALRTDILYRAA